jgi:membrane protein YqaA with SNARE-associated domain
LELPVTWIRLTSWLKSTLPALGTPGLLLSAFLDSSFIPMPLVTDLIVMELSSRHPLKTPYYAALAALGSLVGCIWLYLLARKGGQVYYENRGIRAKGRMEEWVREFPLTCVLLPAMAPFPVPLKPFVLAQGVLQVPFVPFVVGTFVGRACLFFLEGLLGARYGPAAEQYLAQRKWVAAAIVLGLASAFLAITRFSSYRNNRQAQGRRR